MFKKLHARLFVHAFCVSLFCIALFCLATTASAQEQIVSYQTTATIEPDSSVQVAERIEYDFGSNLKRGIYRDIDTVKKIDNKSYRLDISDVTVLDENGRPYEVEILNRREDIRLNIGGDEPRWTEVTIFEISYTVDGLFVFNENNDALLLDVIGFDWEVPILDSRATVLLPEAVKKSDLVYECFVGQPGSTKQCNEIQIDDNTNASGTTSVQVNQLNFEHSSELGNGAGMTIGVTFPKGLVTETLATEIEPVPSIFTFWLILSLVPLVVAAIHFYLQAKTKMRLPVVRQYDSPDNIALFEAGLLLNHTYRTNHLAAQIISLAQRGYIKIVHYEKKVFLVFKKSEYLYVQIRSGDDLPVFDRTLLEALTAPQFVISNTTALEAISADESVSEEIVTDITTALNIAQVSKLQNKFSKSFQMLSKQARSTAVTNGIFTDDFTTARLQAVFGLFKYLLVSGGSLVLLFIVLNLFYSERSFGTLIPVIVAAQFIAVALLALCGIYIYQLPKPSQKGVAAKEHLLGLKQYMEVAEEERMEFHFDPEKNPELFEKLLAYAVLLGMEKRWVKHLEKLDHQPNWYHSSSGQHFSAASLNSVVSSMSSSTRSSSTGAGSAGGGFGGGGGGSR